jgi:ribose transport system ATP-binding protein/rhamnose transport system ATP-binding protein
MTIDDGRRDTHSTLSTAAMTQRSDDPGPSGGPDRPLLRIATMSKAYGSIQALDRVDFELRAGEVMALVGENGAGKSTLVKVLAGLVRPDAGEIMLEGKPVGHGQALRHAGIAVVQQELSLVPTMSAAENVFLGHPDAGLFQTPGRLAQRARPYLAQVGLSDLDPDVLAGSLVVAEQQLVEVARLVARDARILILDEPTAALSDAEIGRVKEVVRRLVAEHRSVIYITHRLGEVFELADRVTVFRNGRSQPPVPVPDITPGQLVERMLGRSLANLFPPRSARIGDNLIELRGVMGAGLTGPVDLVGRAGEIVGLAGQVGSGAASLLGVVGGAHPLLAGEVIVGGVAHRIASPAMAKALGIAYCSGDRKHDGLFGIRSVSENLTSPALRRITVAGVLSPRRERRMATASADFFQVSRRRLGSAAMTLSGGNQQKVALGKWLGIEPRVLLVDEPTRGVDVGARAEIYGHLRRLADGGQTIIFASSDIAEVLGLADTIVTFYRGREIARYAAEAVDERTLVRDITHPEVVADGVG